MKHRSSWVPVQEVVPPNILNRPHSVDGRHSFMHLPEMKDADRLYI
jgi:hypothetical protein